MTLFGPTLVAGLPAWPPASDADAWRKHPAELQRWETPTRRKDAMQFRALDPVEWLEFAARLGAPFSAFDYEILRASAMRVLQEDAQETMTSETDDVDEVRDEFWSETQQSWVHTQSTMSRILAHCQVWCRSQILGAMRDDDGVDGSYVPMVNQYGRVYLCRGISWEEES